MRLIFLLLVMILKAGFIFSNNDSEKLKIIDQWLEKKDLNIYGDPKGWFYTGGTPLFDESTGQRTDRLDYLIAKFPNAPWEQEPPMNDEVSNLAKADMWLKEMNLNEYGDEIGTMYMGGTPLFNESTGIKTDRYTYLKKQFPELPWMTDIPVVSGFEQKLQQAKPKKNKTGKKHKKKMMIESKDDYPECASAAFNKIGDGFCDIQYNSSECGYDGGDCI